MSLSPGDKDHLERTFLAEVEENLGEFGRNLQLLADSPRIGGASPELINAIFRSVHSFKTLVAMLGYTAATALAHETETLLDLIRLGRTPVDGQAVEVLFAALDGLEALASAPGSAENPSSLLERISACCARTVARPSPDTARPILPERITAGLNDVERHRLEESIRNGRLLFLLHASFLLESFAGDFEELIALLGSQGEVICTVPTPAGEQPDAIGFDILVGAEQPPEALPVGVIFRKIAFETAGEEPVGSGQCEHPAAGPRDAAPPSRKPGGSVRVDIGALDELMALVGELVAVRNSLTEEVEKIRAVAPATATGLTKTAGRLAKKLSELQDGVKEIRLVPVRTLYDKLTRVVRKIADDQGRELELVLHGAETRLDKQLIEDLSDPLTHLIRNAVDHGIESPDERLAAGKSAAGRITVTAGQKGNRVVIEVLDDGRGIDLAKVRRLAASKGLLRSHDALPDRETLDLIFEPGFSTTDAVSELSGRGVGLDVVKSNIRALSGTVSAETQPGVGSRFLITLPITLAIIRTLVIDAGDQSYGVPVSSIQETVAVEGTGIQTRDGAEVLPVRDMILPVVRLERFFGGTDLCSSGDAGFAVVAGADSQRVGIMADGIRGQLDLVVKPLGDLLAGIRGVAGAADIGDERTILILDPVGIGEDVYRGMTLRVP